MPTKRLLLCLPVAMLAAFISCSEPAEDINPHPAGWVEIHPARVRATNYNFTSCGQCHGTDLAGGEVADGCSRESCHTAVESVYSCDNRHGSTSSVPFANVAGDTSTDVLTVGAHTSHYTASRHLTSNVNCASCHIVPDSVWAEGHIDTSAHAEVNFGPLGDVAAVGSDNSWDRSTGECSNIYCHGNWAYERADSTGKFVTGNNITMTWTEPVAGNLCGTCHGLPPTGHRDMFGLSCGVCHSSVLSADDMTVITGLKNHINGMKNLP